MTQSLAFDRIPSARWKDEDGRLHVDRSNFSKVQVAPYRGSEIIGWEKHHLDPNRMYMAYRPAEELSKPETIKSIVGIPIQYEHHIDTPDQPADTTRIGVTGDQATFEDPYLVGSMHLFDAKAIKKIQAGEKRELSLAYYYVPDFTPGETEAGEHYDFVMRNIRATHLAVVEEGRAGKDCCVMDSTSNGGKAMNDEDKSQDIATDDSETEKKEVQIGEAVEQAGKALQDLHKTDEKGEIVDNEEKNVTPATDEGDKGAMAQALQKKLEALGLSPEDLEECKGMIASLATDEDPAQDDEPEVNPAIAKALEENGYEVTPDYIRAVEIGMGLVKPAADDGETDPAGSSVQDDGEEVAQDDGEDSEKDQKVISQDSAMKRFGAMQDALEDVRGVVGKLRLANFDSAGGIYLHALKKMGVQMTGLNAKNARAAFFAYQAGAANKTKVNTRRSSLAQDSAPKSSLLDKVGANVHIY